MKKRFLIATVAFASVLLASCVLEFDPNDRNVERHPPFMQGTDLFNGDLQGSAPGFGGAVNVSFRISNGNIMSFSFDAPQDTDSYVEMVRNAGLPMRIILSNGFYLDTVSGATVTSRAVLQAGINAVNDAGLTRQQ